MRHLIIGAGPAGVVAAETLRQLDSSSDILLIGDESEPPYSRMAIPYLLRGRIGEEGTYLRKSARYFEERRIEILQERVSTISTDNRSVRLESGNVEAYDRLLIATGSSPTSPPIDGVDLPGVHSCWTLEDARSIAARSSSGSKVVLMGAGFIGCIILEALASCGVDLTVVELENRMVPRMMNQVSGGLIKSWCERRGVTVLTDTRVEGIASKDSQLMVSLSEGEEILADLVINATGVRPNTSFLEKSGIEVDHGILVDQNLRTTCKDIFAAGDVCQGRDFSTGDYTVQAIQPTAVEHGKVAASNMTDGQEVIHRGCLNMNILDTMGLVSTSFGAWEGIDGGQSVECSDLARFRYLDLQFDGDVLVGANALGLTEHIGVIRGLIQTRLRLGVWKERLMDNPLQLMEAYVAVAHGVSDGRKPTTSS
ncbi:MAG: FAD-dependent oxidoreductase [Acidiferrobacteraceae bacterium]|nr:FAD-dependent oxidoreductase [Acidiferrobacteraceae bacterium]|tara:strand:+ start:268 stop:1542 length:1275 start_codon:yes stop_codon:yes gene_type:complete